MVNPYSVTSAADTSATGPHQGVFGDSATLRKASFLYRVIELSSPIQATFIYSGWWFRQKITFDGMPVWWQISWLWIRREATFRLPQAVDPAEREGRIEIDFTRGLRIARFRLWIAEELVYDEVAA